MWSSAVALCLLLTALPGGDLTAPDPQYMLLVPTILHGGREDRFCLQLSHLNESVTVTVTLELERQNETLLQKHVTEPDDDQCVTFKTPQTNSTEVGFLTLDADGDSLHFKSRKSVLIKPLQSLVFIQTDKPIYKPGQKVQFRIASLDENFLPISEKFPVVYIQDPQGNRLSQWLDLETHRGITQESFLLTAEPRLGTYRIIAERGRGIRVEYTFSVEEYVLPKYEVQVSLPPILTILDEEVKVTVCGKYTYGKPVSGLINVRVCRMFTQSYSQCPGEENSVCEELSHQADSNGCFSEVVKTKVFQMKRTGYEMKIKASAKITEDGTGVELTGEGSSEIRSTIAKVSFKEVDSHYKHGIPLFGQVFLEDAAGKPISNETVVIYVGYEGTNYTYITGKDGTAEFSINTTSFQQSSINIRASYQRATTDYCHRQRWLTPTYEEDSRSINQFYSRSKSYLQIQPIHRVLECQVPEKITVHYILTPEGVRESKNAVYHYLVMAKGSIVKSGKHTVALIPNEEAHGKLLIDLPIGVKTAPLVKILVYLILDSGEVLADSISLKVEKCFVNKVKLSFSPTEALPGSEAALNLLTEPNSLCALRAVDKSVLLMKPEAELSAQSVYNLLPVQDLSGYNHEGHYLEEPRDDPCLKIEPIFMNGLYYNPTTPEWDTDAYMILKDMGLKVFTNTNIRIPTLCQTGRGGGVGAPGIHVVGSPTSARVVFPQASARLSYSGDVQYMSEMDANTIEMIETVRKYFPETWLWDLIETDSHGKAELKLTVPDSITTWKASMFCTSPIAGFGLSEPMSLLTFQPFFLDLTMPYSAIRGEMFSLKASVFNYLSHTIRVSVSLENSDQFLADPTNKEEEGYCVGVNSRVTVSWIVTLKSLGEVNFTVSAQTLPGEGLCGNEIVENPKGRKDTITKHILVEPEGVEKEETQNAMICGKDSEISEKISLELPDHVVEGSARASFSVLGDVLGTAMQNLGSLLQMPFGCGEQNMVLFTPNIYILEYLNNTGQLTPEVKSKALNYMSSGYQKQLSYKHSDGSYSAFGPQFDEGNTWLTAFVMKSFARARSYIYIDQNLLSGALLWLSHRQKDNGCFRSDGKLFNNAMKGGVDDEVALTAYITIALLEYPLPVTHPVVRNALFCLESAMKGQNGVYTQTLMAYAFTLAEKLDKRSQLLQSLDEQSIKDDSAVHWHRPEFSDESKQSRFPHSRAPSVEVEMTSYVLLALLSTPKISNQEMTLATKIVIWIIRQQNPSGGFSSTQDTVVALQALSVFGSHTVSHEGQRTVSLSLDSNPIATLNVQDSNRLLLQRVSLTKIPGDYTASISGAGCLYLQTTLRYNIPHPEGDAAFFISVTPEPETCDHRSLKTFGIAVNVSYVGKRQNSNMAIVDIKLPSGYIPVKASVRQLTNHNLIKRTETLTNKVIVYFESLAKEVRSFRFLVEQDIPVSNLQPATAIVYDYYETDEFAVTKYSAPCSSKDDSKST